MSERRKYKVIVSDRAKQMLGVHIRFLAQVDKDAARNKKNDTVYVDYILDCRKEYNWLIR